MLETLTWHCCTYCNPETGRVDIEERLPNKTQLDGLESKESFQLTETTILLKVSNKTHMSSTFVYNLTLRTLQPNYIVYV